MKIFKKLFKLIGMAFCLPIYLMFGAATVTSYDLDTTRKKQDVESTIARLVPDASPFTAILMQISKETTNQDTIYWYDSEPFGRWGTVSAAHTNAVLTFTVADSSILQPSDLVYFPATGEYVIVATVPSNTSFTVASRAWSGTATALTTGAYFVVLGNAMTEGSSVPGATKFQPTQKYNYVQEIRTPFITTLTSAGAALLTNEDERDRMTKEKMLEHRMKLELACLYGARQTDSTNMRKTMGGIVSTFVSTNVWNVGGLMAEADFMSQFCEPLFRYDSSPALLVASPRVLTQINNYALGRLETTNGDDTYGMKLRIYRTPYGDLYLTRSLAMENYYNGSGLGVHMKNLKLKTFSGYSTKLDRDIQSPDFHGHMDEIWGMYTLECRLEKTHAYLYGVTA